MTARLDCNCMVLFDPPLPPIEHAEDCPVRAGWRKPRRRKPRVLVDDGGVYVDRDVRY